MIQNSWFDYNYINMQIDTEKQLLFEQQLKKAKVEEMINMLRCKLCNGLYRFAHTLVECGHTFCQQCIFAHIKTFKGKNPEVKCPQCYAIVQPIYHRSVIRDVFKQSLVDLLDPSFSVKEKLIIERIRKLFPEFNLQFLLDEFSFSSIDNMKRKRAEKTKLMSSLAGVVRDKLGITFEQFSQQILSENAFNELLRKLNSLTLPSFIEEKIMIIDIRPLKDRDYKFVGINNRLKPNNLKVQKIRKFLEKKLLLQLQNNEDLAKELINPQCNNFQVHIDLLLQNRLLLDSENLAIMPQAMDYPIFYSIPFQLH